MKYLILSILILSGCSSIQTADMPKQCLVAVGDGSFRYGLIMGVKGEGTIVKIGEAGKGCEGKKIFIIKEGVEVKIGD